MNEAFSDPQAVKAAVPALAAYKAAAQRSADLLPYAQITGDRRGYDEATEEARLQFERLQLSNDPR